MIAGTLFILFLGMANAIPWPTFEMNEARNYVYYSFSAYCLNRSISQWNCHFCKGDTGGFQPTLLSRDPETDTFVYTGVHQTRKECKEIFYSF
jgi:hypothetical protein